MFSWYGIGSIIPPVQLPIGDQSRVLRLKYTLSANESATPECAFGYGIRVNGAACGICL